MSKELVTVNTAAGRLQRRMAQDLESGITAAAEAALARDARIELEARPDIMLGREVQALAGRMRWLQTHPHVPRFLGGSAVKLAATKTHIQTPLLFATDYDTGIVQGYQFETPHAVREGELLDVRHLLVDTSSGRGESVDDGSYHIYVSNLDSEYPDVKVTGGAISVYQEEAADDVDGKIRAFEDADTCIGSNVELREEWNQLMFECEEARRYCPLELYMDPLGLVTQANDALSRTKRR